LNSERLPMRTKLGFGVGSIGESAIGIAFNTWNFLFYNNVLGLSGTLCGLAVILSLVLDAVLDPVVGSLSDRLRSRWGRRHPFLYAAPIPLAVCFGLIYMPPAGLAGLGLFAWFTVFAMLQRQALTLYQVPHLALGAELSDDYRERTIVMSYNAIFAVVGGSVAYTMGWHWFSKVPGGSTVRDGYAAMGISVGALSALSIFLSAFATHDRIPRLRTSQHTTAFSLPELLREMRGCFRNHNYRALLFGLVLLSVTIGTRETLNPYSSLFFWELTESKLRVFGGAAPIAFVLGFFLTVRLHDWIDKRATMVGAMILLSLAAGLPVPMRLAGVMPANGSSDLIGVLFLFVFLFYLAIAVLTITLLSALADIVDEHELDTGLRQEGVFFASRTFFAKMTTGFGHVLAGVAVDVIGFPSGAKPGQVAQEIVDKLAIVEGPLGAVFALVSVFCYLRYRLDRARHQEIQRALSARRAASLAVVPDQTSRVAPDPLPG
jgi:glycoside/pentoside/hexuronide:cation symporter, GPH family